MLRILIYLFLIISPYLSFSNNELEKLSEDDIEWARSLSRQGKEAFKNEVKKTIDKPWFDPKLKENIIKPRPALQIFVSSSMPIGLLKEYAREAKKYGGALVLSGLPKGSVQEFTSLVLEISDENTAPVQIDDEAFRAFDIKTVPSIVLAKRAPIFDGRSATETFDKIVGAVKIKAALDRFASEGEMRESAMELLR